MFFCFTLIRNLQMAEGSASLGKPPNSSQPCRCIPSQGTIGVLTSTTVKRCLESGSAHLPSCNYGYPAMAGPRLSLPAWPVLLRPRRTVYLSRRRLASRGLRYVGAVKPQVKSRARHNIPDLVLPHGFLDRHKTVKALAVHCVSLPRNYHPGFDKTSSAICRMSRARVEIVGFGGFSHPKTTFSRWYSRCEMSESLRILLFFFPTS